MKIDAFFNLLEEAGVQLTRPKLIQLRTSVDKDLLENDEINAVVVALADLGHITKIEAKTACDLIEEMAGDEEDGEENHTSPTAPPLRARRPAPDASAPPEDVSPAPKVTKAPMKVKKQGMNFEPAYAWLDGLIPTSWEWLDGKTLFWGLLGFLGVMLVGAAVIAVVMAWNSVPAVTTDQVSTNPAPFGTPVPTGQAPATEPASGASATPIPPGTTREGVSLFGAAIPWFTDSNKGWRLDFTPPTHSSELLLYWGWWVSLALILLTIVSVRSESLDRGQPGDYRTFFRAVGVFMVTILLGHGISVTLGDWAAFWLPAGTVIPVLAKEISLLAGAAIAFGMFFGAAEGGGFDATPISAGVFVCGMLMEDFVPGDISKSIGRWVKLAGVAIHLIEIMRQKKLPSVTILMVGGGLAGLVSGGLLYGLCMLTRVVGLDTGTTSLQPVLYYIYGLRDLLSASVGMAVAFAVINVGLGFEIVATRMSGEEGTPKWLDDVTAKKSTVRKDGEILFWMAASFVLPWLIG